MADHFALFGQPRQTWLDPNELKDRYQRLAKVSHPDHATAATAESDFGKLAEAYRVLVDDKLRLQHLLQLEGVDPSRNNAVPARLLPLFSNIGEFMARSDQLQRRLNEAANPLSKSILQAEVIACRNEVARLLQQTRRLVEEARQESVALNSSWPNELPRVAELYLLFAYLGRWLAQLEERSFLLETV